MTACSSCDSPSVSRLVTLDRVPIHVNIPQPCRSRARHVSKGTTRLAICRDCGHIFNTAFDPRAVEYGPGYENSLDFSPQFRKYLHCLAQRLVKQYRLQEKEIIEIACGKGEFLKELCELGRNRGTGFDPSHLDDENTTSEDVHFVKDFYSSRYKHYKADFIGCRQALEHIQYPREFLRSIRQVLEDQYGVALFFEVPNSEYTLRNVEIWDIIYEHPSYFCMTSLARTFSGSGFIVRELREEYGGQFLSIITQPATETETKSPTTDNWYVRKELLEQAESFKARYHDKVRSWSHQLRELSSAGKRTVIWGTGSKGVTFLNVVKPARHSIDYAVDIHPEKSGMFVAGTGQRIVPPKFLKGYQPDTVIVMNPIYEKEIRKMLNEMKLDPQVLVA